MRIFSESPLDRRDHANRLSCHIIHEFRFSRIDFCSVARCCQRAGENDFYDPPRAFTGISRVHSTATVARTVSSLGASYCTRIFISRASAFARLRAAASAPESAVGRKRAGESGSYDPLRAFTVISRVHSIATVARTVSSLGASYCTRIFVSRASAFARLRKVPACGQKRLLRPSR